MKWDALIKQRAEKIKEIEIDELSRQVDDKVDADNEGPTFIPPVPSTNRGSNESSSNDESDSDDDIFDRPPRRQRVVDDNNDDDDADGVISDNIEDETETTTLTGGNMVTPGRNHTGRGSLQEAGFDRSGNTYFMFSSTNLTNTPPEQQSYNARPFSL